jgi:hypothetical protein
MKKTVILVLITVITISLGLTLIPNVSSQVEDAQVLSYSYYMHPYYTDRLIIVGEVQNTGSNVIDQIAVTGTFYAPDETIFMQNTVLTLTTQILPNQKSPFYLTFSPDNILVSTNWTSQDVTDYNITVTYAPTTEARQYKDLTITSQSEATDAYGSYYVSGTVKNTGTESTNKTWVVATFYNSTGSVVSVGYSEVLIPNSIAPGGTADFTIYPADYTSAGNIASYSLIIQTKLTASSTPTPTPSATPSASPTSTPSSSASPTPTPTPPANGTGIPDAYIYAAIIAVIVVVAIVALVLRKRSGKHAATPQKTEE